MSERRRLDFLERYPPPEERGMPKYARLRAALVSAIENGYWAPGAKLPTEQELTGATPYSLGTVQRAMRALVEDGIVVRRQGSGSYVATAPKQIDDPWHLRFRTADGRGFLPVTPQVVLRERVEVRGPWSEPLGQEEDNILRVDRRIDIGDEFAVYSRFFVNADRFGSLLYRPLAELDDANFKQILLDEFDLPVTHVSQDVRMAIFPPDVCEAIDVEDETVGLFLQVVASAGAGNPVYYQELLIPPTERALHVSDLREGSEA